MKKSASIDLAALRPVKEDPDGEVIAEVFEPMFDSGGCEQDISWRESLPSAITNEFAGALGHNIDFVARMRRLRIVAARRVKLYD